MNDNQNEVNRILLDHGMLGATNGEEFRFFPWEEDNWLYLACLTPGGTEKMVLRLPASTPVLISILSQYLHLLAFFYDK